MSAPIVERTRNQSTSSRRKPPRAGRTLSPTKSAVLSCAADRLRAPSLPRLLLRSGLHRGERMAHVDLQRLPAIFEDLRGPLRMPPHHPAEVAVTGPVHEAVPDEGRAFWSQTELLAPA
jgi:hypothetical protein